jgi:SpoVK/Ycf46/Vps4 family AAA+-type ATPase
MELAEILTFLDRLSLEQRGRRLSRIEREILDVSWENRTYQDIKSCQEQTAKNKARSLWADLSKLLNTKVNKANVREVLETLNVLGMGSRSSDPTNLHTEILGSNGRLKELLQLQQWIEVNRHKLIFIYGMKGIGKSYLAQEIVRILSANLDYLVYIPLEKPTQLINILSIIIRRIGGGRSSKLSGDLSTAIDKTIGYLQTSRCLLILDNADTIFGNNRQQTTDNRQQTTDNRQQTTDNRQDRLSD